ncbi:PREDICTED: uncharacterized protein LOC109216861 [Nicotiana attenuata]|uniref:uncharacterized protein LOC109216861 n=1 Tax=Nicotiana attenuata TaxID=49451 RepID=UPI000904AC88|nr:PREDICTED: uncharacterized protein LOC109216861 [Nicotiana attenuata]
MVLNEGDADDKAKVMQSLPLLTLPYLYPEPSMISSPIQQKRKSQLQQLKGKGSAGKTPKKKGEIIAKKLECLVNYDRGSNSSRGRALPMVVSDHKPIVLESGVWSSDPSYFKSENMWLKQEGFLDPVKQWWQKIETIKKDLAIWNNEVFGKLSTKINNVLEELQMLEQATEGREQTLDVNNNILRLKVEIQQLAKTEETSWRNKSRCLWLKEGDRNTKYFQRIANSNRSYNHIDRLQVGKDIIKDKEQVKEAILDFYQELYTENEDRRLTATFEGLGCLSSVEKEELEYDFEEEEVRYAINSCAPDKSPGPDGFSMALYQKCWDTLRLDIMGALSHSMPISTWLNPLMHPLFAFVPKRKGAIELKDFRPIRLIGRVHKILAKVLTERLKKVIGKVVSSYQNAFIKGRQIINAARIANEVLDWRHKSSAPGLLFKMDIEKAFDKLKWKFLVSIFWQMGFGMKWIKYSFTTVKYSILVNRSPVGFFSPERGIRQWDPLSPFLFILAMEGRSKIVEKAKQLQWIKGFKAELQVP